MLRAGGLPGGGFVAVVEPDGSIYAKLGRVAWCPRALLDSRPKTRQDGAAGDDLLLGGRGVDRITGDFRAGNLQVLGVSGNGGNDTIEGGEDGDTIIGDSVAPVVSGRGGNDILDGGPRRRTRDRGRQ